MDIKIFAASHKGSEASKGKAASQGKSFASAAEKAQIFAAMKEALGPLALPWDIARAWIEASCQGLIGRAPASKADWNDLSSAHHSWKIHDPKRPENAFPADFKAGAWQGALARFCCEPKDPGGWSPAT